MDEKVMGGLLNIHHLLWGGKKAVRNGSCLVFPVKCRMLNVMNLTNAV